MGHHTTRDPLWTSHRQHMRCAEDAERWRSPAGVEKGLAALPSLRTGRETFASSGSPEKEMYCDSTVPFPYGATGASRAKPSSMPPVATGTVPSFLLPSWQSFTVSRTLHPGIWLLRCLRPPSHTLAFSRPLSRQSGRGVPQFQDIRRIEIPVAACYRPGAVGTTYRHSSPVGTRHRPILGQVYQPLSPVRFHGL